MVQNILATKSLKTFWKTLKEFTHRFGASAGVSDTDTLGRYITSSSHYSKENDRVKHTALLPIKNKVTKNYETSVFNLSGLNSIQIESIAKKYILTNLQSGRSIYGTAKTVNKNIKSVGLRAEIFEPPKRHLNIVGWPEEKSKRKQIAMELASKCTFSLFDNALEKL